MGLKIKYFNYLVRKKMFSLLFLVSLLFFQGLAIQKTESPTKKQQRRIRRYRVQCPYSLPDGVDLWKLRMRERYGSPFPGEPYRWYLEEVVDVVTSWTMERGNHSIHKVIRYGLKSTACKKQSRTYPVYSDLIYDSTHRYDIYNCVAFYKEGWKYLDFSPVLFCAKKFDSTMDEQQKTNLHKTKEKTAKLKGYKPSLCKIEE
jgi:hypothetical protein